MNIKRCRVLRAAASMAAVPLVSAAALGQSPPSYPHPWLLPPQLDIHALAGPNQTVFVSEQRIEFGEWAVRPLYSFTSAANVRVEGLFFSALPGTTTGENLEAIYLQRPEDPCAPWSGVTWPGGTPWDAARSLKGALGITDEQDFLWDLDQTSAGGVVEMAVLAGSVAQNDPVAAYLASLPPGERADVIELLKLAGYPVADVDFDLPLPAAREAWLARAAAGFEYLIGHGLSHTAERGLGACGMGGAPFVVEGQVVRGIAEELLVTWLLANEDPLTSPVSNCRPGVWYTPWRPFGPVCDCTTEGPIFLGCFTFASEAVVGGRLKIWVPPLGSIEVNVGEHTRGELTRCVCGWRRICTGLARRTGYGWTTDCRPLEEVVQYSSREFRFTAWAYEVVGDQAACAVFVRPPAIMPGNEEPCGLEHLVPELNPEP